MKSFIDIEELNKNIPQNVSNQLKALLKKSELQDNENSFCKITESWLLKQAMFNKIIEHGDFKKTSTFNKKSGFGCIAVTISGSILSIGPLINEKRKVIYTSIDFRNDVPKILEEENAKLQDDIIVGKIASFSEGMIKSTSEIYSLCVPKTEDKEEEEINKIIVTNKLILDNFLQLNETTFKANYYDNDLYIKNDLFKKWIILKWFIIGGFDKHVFTARCKILWLELFSKFHKELIKNKKLEKKADEIFLEFTNVKFAKFIDDYKWYKSEKINYDLGLLKALEEIPGYKNYWDFTDQSLKEINKL